MPPKANESIDSFFSPVSTDAHSNIDMLMLEAGLYEHKESIRQAEFPSMAEFLAKYADLPPVYYKTYLPGEAELTARVYGVEDRVNPYTYLHTQAAKDVPLETIADWTGKLEDIIDKKDFPKGTSYLPEESPLSEVETNIFEVNQETEFGKNLQDRINLAYTLALLNDSYRTNPDTGEEMLTWEEELLGNVYFDESGKFEDVWDIGIGEYEPIFTNEGHPLSVPLNIARYFGQDAFQMNIPKIKGQAEWLGKYKLKE